VIGGAVALIGVIGAVVSFARVSAAAGPTFGWLAPAVPVGVDLGILTFSAAGLLLAYLDMPARWVRIVPWALTGATIYLNVIGETDPFAIVAHAVLPGLWVLAIGVGEHVIRSRFALDTGRRMDSVRPSRWLLAPWATGRLWRRMVLWEVRSYPKALKRERRRLYATAHMRDAYGLAWRWRAPRRERVAHRLGELDVPGRDRRDQDRDQDRQGRDQDRPDLAGVQPYDDGQPLPPSNAAALLAAGRQVAADLALSGRDLTRTSLVSGLRGMDVAISTDRASELLRQLRSGQDRQDRAVLNGHHERAGGWR
jgi:hypothetical protein